MAAAMTDEATWPAMSEKNTDNKELSMDELKDVAGGGMGLDRLGTQKTKGKKKSKGTSLVGMETGTVYIEDGVLSSDDAADVSLSNPTNLT